MNHISNGIRPVDGWGSDSKDYCFDRRRANRFMVFFPILLVALSSCSHEPGTTSGDNPENLSKADPISVVWQTPERKVLRQTTTQPATVHAYFQAEIYAKVAGYLDKLLVDIGQNVEKDTVLGLIAVPELEKRKQVQQAEVKKCEAEQARAAANIEVAEANIKTSEAFLAQVRAELGKQKAILDADEREFQRVNDLVQKEALERRLLDEATKRYESSKAAMTAAKAALLSAQESINLAKAKLEVAKAEEQSAAARVAVARNELEELEALYSFSILKAPFKGTVVARHVEPGDLVRNSETSSGKQPLFVVADLEKVRVRVSVPERDTPYLKVGAKASINLLAMRGRPLNGIVSRIARMLDENTRTMLVEIDVPNPTGALLPGMFGQATIELQERPNSLVLPAQLVRYDHDGKSYVYVVDGNNTIHRRDVATGLDDGERIEITAGLTGEERIVAPTVQRLNPGQQVQVVSGNGSKPAS